MGDADGATEAVEDGRRARRQRNRDAVVDALLQLVRAGDLQPSADEVAAKAGLSPRSLFRYFDDVDDLCRAAIARQQDRLRGLLELTVEPGAPLAARASAVADQRVALFEGMGAVGALARLREPFQPLIADQLAQTRSYLRHQLEQAFAPELAVLGPRRGPDRLAAADVVSSFEAYQLLRRDHRLGTAACTGVLAGAIVSLFTTEDP